MLGRLLGYLIVLTISLSMSPAAGAGTLVLTSGQRISGKIIEKNDLYVTVESLGTPMTYYLGEIASIDGQEIEIQEPPQIAPAPAEEKQIIVPSPVPSHNNEEEGPLIKFMDSRHPNAAPQNNPVDQKVSPTPPKGPSIVPKAPPVLPSTPPVMPPKPEKPETLAYPMNDRMSKKGEMNRPMVVPTPDGGIIVVTAQKIVKYDKDLELVKELDLK